MNTKNAERAERAAQALDRYAELTEDPDSSICDLLADLMHYCKSTSYDFEQELATATMHFDAEY